MELELKIKLDSGKKFTLDDDEARELYQKLHGLYGSPVVYPQYVPWYTPYRWFNTTDSTTTCTHPSTTDTYIMDGSEVVTYTSH